MLVHRDRTRSHTGPGVGDFHDFEESLNRPVFAAGPVECDERDVDFALQELLRQGRIHIKKDRIIPPAQERVVDRPARHERDLPLSRCPTDQNPNA